MENIVALGVVTSQSLSLRQTEKPFAKSTAKLRKGCMVKVIKIGSRSHAVFHNNQILYAKAGSLNLILKSQYSHADFLNDLSKSLHFQEPRLMWENTLTLSALQNSGHRLVTPLERFLKTLGYYQGQIEEDEGNSPVFGVQLEKAVRDYQAFYMLLPPGKQDGRLQAQGLTWKSLLCFSLH